MKTSLDPYLFVLSLPVKYVPANNTGDIINNRPKLY